MQAWIWTSLQLCTFGILKEFRPSEPYVTKYLNNPPVNFTIDEINSVVYPVGAYSNLILLVFIFLLTDILRYKPIIILEGLAGIAVYVTLIFCRQIFWGQMVEFFYGLFMSCDVAYYTYLYSVVDKEHYSAVTSHARAAYLFGRAISGVVGQTLISSGKFSYYSLNFFTLGGMILATVWALFLPPVKSSIYFHRGSDTTNDESKKGLKDGLKRGAAFIWEDLKVAFTNRHTIKWAFWWALATCGYSQVLSFVQVLWQQVLKESNESDVASNLNGAIEAAYTITSGFVSLGFGRWKLDWEKWGTPMLTLSSLIIGAILFVMAESRTIWLSYVTYVSYTILYHGLITVANSEVAKAIKPDSFGLIFGITTFVALVLQTVLTAIVNSWLSLSGRAQFLVYGGYFTVLGLILGVDLLIYCLRYRRSH